MEKAFDAFQQKKTTPFLANGILHPVLKASDYPIQCLNGFEVESIFTCILKNPLIQVLPHKHIFVEASEQRKDAPWRKHWERTSPVVHISLRDRLQTNEESLFYLDIL